MAPSTPPTPPPAVEPSHGIVAQLRAWTRLMTLADMAHVFGYEDNPKRVYELPIKRAPIGPGGDRALRWDPSDVADYIEARMKMPLEKSESSPPADDNGV